MNVALSTVEPYTSPSRSERNAGRDIASRRWGARKAPTMRGTQFAQLAAFAAVAEHCSFTRAAEHLGLSTPSLSQAIRSLEEDFGVRLLNRTTRSVALTEAGERLLTHLAPVLDGVDHAIDSVNDFRDNPVGTLRLSVHPLASATIIAPLVASFSSAYPSIGLEVSVDMERRDIVGDRFDAGIHPGNHIAQDMIAVQIPSQPQLVTVASPGYLASHAKPETPEDLRSHNCIRYRWDREGVAQSWKFSRGDHHVEAGVDGSLTINNLDFALRAALDGLGIVQLPQSSIAGLLAEGRLVHVLDGWTPQGTDFFLFYSSRRHVPTKLRALIDYLKKKRSRDTDA